MGFIYYIWSGDKHGRGGYIGLDSSNTFIPTNNRISDHILSIKSKNPDGAGLFIAEKGISNVVYGYWDSSSGYGVGKQVLDAFHDAGWVANTGSNSNRELMSAEVLHIIYNIEKNCQRETANTTIGGQLTGDKLEYYPQKTFAGEKLEPVVIHFGDRIQRWPTTVRNKLFFPEQYAISKKVLQDFLLEFLQDPSIWVSIIKNYVIPRIEGSQPKIDPNRSLQIRFTKYIKQQDPGFSWQRYNIKTPNIDFDSFVRNFEDWFLTTIKGSLDNFINRHVNPEKLVPKKLFYIKASTYARFEPINNKPPQWFNLLIDQDITNPSIRTPSDVGLVKAIQIAATKVFSHIIENTPKTDLSFFKHSPSPSEYLRTRVEKEMEKYGFHRNHFLNWELSYRYYVSCWMTEQKHPLLLHSSTNGVEAVSSWTNPTFYYYFASNTWSLISSIKQPQDIPFKLL